MSKEDLANRLNGFHYPARELRAFADEAKELGLVMAYGQSDDLFELDGAIYEEYCAWNGCIVPLDENGIVATRCCDEDCPYDKERIENAPHWVKAEWCPKSAPEYSWVISASVPTASFDIVEDGEPYCRGIVFSMADLKKSDD